MYEGNAPKHVQESAQDVVGLAGTLKFSSILQMELKGDKRDSRLIAISEYRVFIFHQKNQSTLKLETSFPVLDIQFIESKLQNKLVIGTDSRKWTFFVTEEACKQTDCIIFHIIEALSLIYPKRNLSEMVPRVDVSPASRLEEIEKRNLPLKQQPLGPCGGFAGVYRGMCDYHGLTYIEEIAWDIDNIYEAHALRELKFSDFDHLDHRLLLPLIAALEYNDWFTVINANNAKLTSDAINEIIRIMKLNQCIEALLLSNTGIKSDFATNLSFSLLSNPACALNSLDLSNNNIGDAGLAHLCSPLGKLPRGLSSLNVASCGLSSRGINKLAESLSSNKCMASTLISLDLSGNATKGEDLSKLFSSLAQLTSIRTLNLSAMEIPLESIFSLLQGAHLEHLNLSKNLYTSRKNSISIEVPLPWKQFFSSCKQLKSVDFSDTAKMPPEAVQMIIEGISANPSVTNLDVNLSNCSLGQIPSSGLAESFSQAKHISSLDLSNNSFDGSFCIVIDILKGCRDLEKLNLSKNFNGSKSKQNYLVMESIVELVYSNKCTLRSLSLADCRLKTDAIILINALGSNTTLKSLNLSGNQIGDQGAKMISKALLINCGLRSVSFDRNGTTANGLFDIATSLRKNFVLREFPTPVHDAAVAVKTNQAKTEEALLLIESLLQRNHSPRKFTDQGYRLQHSFLLGSNQKLLSKLESDLTRNLRVAEGSEDLMSVISADVESATKVKNDASHSQQVELLRALQDVAKNSNSSVIQDHLLKVSNDLQSILEGTLKKSSAEMLSHIKSQCSSLIHASDLPQLVEGVNVRSKIPRNFAESLLVEQVAVDFENKINACNLNCASFLSDAVLESSISATENWVNILSKHIATAREASGKDEVQAALRKSLLRPDKEEELNDAAKKSAIARKTIKSRCRPQSTLDTESVLEVLQPRESEASPVPAPRRKKTPSSMSTISAISTDSKSSAILPTQPLKEQKVLSKSETSLLTEVSDVVEINLQENAAVTKSMESLTESSDLTDSSIIESRGSTPGSDLPTSPITAVPTPKSQSPAKKLSSSLDLPELNATAPRLEHLGKYRPKRAKTRAATRATVCHTNVVTESVPEEGIDEFYSNKPSSKSATLGPTTTRKESEDEDGATKKKKGLNIGVNIGGFFLGRKSPSTRKDSKQEEKEKEMEKEEEKEERRESVKTPEPANDQPSPVKEEAPKRPPVGAARLPGLGGLGGLGGGALLEEMKLKRTTMISKPKPKEEPKPPAKPATPPKDTTDESPRAKPAIPARPRPAPKPAPKPSAKSPGLLSTSTQERSPSPQPTPRTSTAMTTSMTSSVTSTASVDLEKPERPSPPRTEPDEKDATDSETPEKPLRKRSSVLEKAAFLDRNSNETEVRKSSAPTKSSTLPKDTEAPKDPVRRSLPVIGADSSRISRLNIKLNKSDETSAEDVSTQEKKEESKDQKDESNGAADSAEVFL